MKSIVFLVSGSGGNLKFFYLAWKKKLLTDCRLIVIADRKCGGLKFAREQGIESHLIDYTKTRNEDLVAVLENTNPDVIVTTWHKIIDQDTVRRFSGRLVNLHYSLLPAFGGLIGTEPVERAYARGCKYIGPTCHLVDEGVDTGRILAQAIFSTERSIEESNELMFRKGCLVLVKGMEIVLGEQLVQEGGNSSESYAPGLSFDENVFDKAFWQEVAMA